MSTKTITITDVENLRAGDKATFNLDGHEHTGPVYEARGDLRFAAHIIRYASGDPGWLDEDDFVSATREVPELPTEPLSVITNVTTNYGVTYPLAFRASRGWHCGNSGGRFDAYVHPSEIVSFELAKVVPADA